MTRPRIHPLNGPSALGTTGLSRFLLRPLIRGAGRWWAMTVIGCALGLGLGGGGIGAAAQKPNLVILLADDAGWGDYGVHGNSER